MSDELDAFDEEDEPAEAFDWGSFEGETDDGTHPDVLRFELGGRSFAASTNCVGEVAAPPSLTMVPGLPPHISGVTVRRRQVLSILDLATFFGLPNTVSSDSRLIVFDIDRLDVGIVVGAIRGLEIWPDDAEPGAPAGVEDRIRRFVLSSRWAPGGRVLLLDIPEVLHAAAVR